MRRTPSTIRLRTCAIRTFIGAVATLVSTLINLTVLMVLKGEPGWLCLLCCNVDIIFSAIVIHWVTSLDHAGSTGSHRSGSSGLNNTATCDFGTSNFTTMSTARRLSYPEELENFGSDVNEGSDFIGSGNVPNKGFISIKVNIPHHKDEHGHCTPAPSQKGESEPRSASLISDESITGPSSSTTFFPASPPALFCRNEKKGGVPLIPPPPLAPIKTNAQYNFMSRSNADVTSNNDK